VIDFKSVIATLKTSLSPLLVGGGLAIVNESASRDPVPQDKAQHLNRIVARNGDECSDGINDRQLSANPGLESIIDLPSQPATEINLSAYSDSYRLTDDRRSN
jgi:hypothetical protein